MTAAATTDSQNLSTWGVAHDADDDPITLQAGHTYDIYLVADPDSTNGPGAGAQISSGELTAQYVATSP